jgi:hypothetical protein
MTSDPRFARRVRRLIAVSSVALGIIFGLTLATETAAWAARLLVAAGWVTMPTLLAASLARPRRRLWLTLPATLVSLGVLTTALTAEPLTLEAWGWWLVTAGLWLGGGLGAWFWYRWLPVPPGLDPPFSAGRWALVAVHVALVSAGVACVFVGLVS